MCVPIGICECVSVCVRVCVYVHHSGLASVRHFPPHQTDSHSELCSSAFTKRLVKWLDSPAGQLLAS